MSTTIIGSWIDPQIAAAEGNLRHYAEQLALDPFAADLYVAAPLQVALRLKVLRGIKRLISSGFPPFGGRRVDRTAASIHRCIAGAGMAQEGILAASNNALRNLAERVEAVEWARAAAFFEAVTDEGIVAYHTEYMAAHHAAAEGK